MRKMILVAALLIGCDNTPTYPANPDGGADGGSKSEPKDQSDDMLWWLLMMG